ncbi:hypothetical protein [Ruicaihuangia caeni]|uniref:hypothetical protein n=1 Tax=Ruicaihuangia caeni TaxID=3042517 RepID=UPI00338FCC86
MSTTIASPRTHDRALPYTVRRVVAMLLLRTVLFALFQAIIAGALALGGADDPLAASAAWWPLAASAANLVNLGVLARLARLEGCALRSIYVPQRATWKRDVLTALGAVVIAAPVSMAPNLGLATLLFGDPQVALDMFVQPLPLWAAIASVVLFPITIALTELPTYYWYVQPRLTALAGSAWVGVIAAAFFHAVQHAALPFILDPSFLLWRALMFLPFALLVALVIRWRPSVLPYLLVVHFAIDMPVALMVLSA